MSMSNREQLFGVIEPLTLVDILNSNLDVWTRVEFACEFSSIVQEGIRLAFLDSLRGLLTHEDIQTWAMRWLTGEEPKHTGLNLKKRDYDLWLITENYRHRRYAQILWQLQWAIDPSRTREQIEIACLNYLKERPTKSVTRA